MGFFSKTKLTVTLIIFMQFFIEHEQAHIYFDKLKVFIFKVVYLMF